MAAAKRSVTSRLYCLMFGLIFWASLLVYFLSAQSGQEVYSEDWLQQYIYVGVFPSFCPRPLLCLELQQETAALPDYSQTYTVSVFAYLLWFKGQSCFGTFLRSFAVLKCLHIWDIKGTALCDFSHIAWLKTFFHWPLTFFFFYVMHRMMNHTMRFIP